MLRQWPSVLCRPWVTSAQCPNMPEWQEQWEVTQGSRSVTEKFEAYHAKIINMLWIKDRWWAGLFCCIMYVLLGREHHLDWPWHAKSHNQRLWWSAGGTKNPGGSWCSPDGWRRYRYRGRVSVFIHWHNVLLSEWLFITFIYFELAFMNTLQCTFWMSTFRTPSVFSNKKSKKRESRIAKWVFSRTIKRICYSNIIISCIHGVMWWNNLTPFFEWQVKTREERTDPDVPLCPRSRLQVTWWPVNLDLHVFLFLELLQTAVSNCSETGPALWLWITLEQNRCHQQQAVFIDLCNAWDVLSILYMQGINFINKAFIYFHACHNWLFIELWNIWFLQFIVNQQMEGSRTYILVRYGCVWHFRKSMAWGQLILWYWKACVYFVESVAMVSVLLDSSVDVLTLMHICRSCI